MLRFAAPSAETWRRCCVWCWRPTRIIIIRGGVCLTIARRGSDLGRYLNVSPGFEAFLALDGDGDPLGYALYARAFWTSECDLALLLKEIFVFEQFRNLGIGGFADAACCGGGGVF